MRVWILKQENHRSDLILERIVQLQHEGTGWRATQRLLLSYLNNSGTSGGGRNEKSSMGIRAVKIPYLASRGVVKTGQRQLLE